MWFSPPTIRTAIQNIPKRFTTFSSSRSATRTRKKFSGTIAPRITRCKKRLEEGRCSGFRRKPEQHDEKLAGIVTVGIVRTMMVPVTARRNNDAERQQRQQRDGFHSASFPHEKIRTMEP